MHSGKLAALLYENHPPAILTGRGDLLEKWTMKALELLSQNEKGFFLLVEGSQ
ncbi:alkaline phosphatase, partial [Bacteroidota bacterium]